MKRFGKISTMSGLLGLGLFAMVVAAPPKAERRAIQFVGGYETDRRDGGRPVVLIASALGLPSEVFREAFSHVHPARGEEPTTERVHSNKQALLSRLEQYGITNERLDEVSNYYRYMGARGETWRHVAASGYAVVSHGVVTGITITNPGAGYSSAPTVVVDGLGQIDAKVTLAFSQDFAKNGSILSVSGGKVVAGVPRGRRGAPPTGLEDALRREAIPREIVDRLNLTADQQRQLVAIAATTNERRELHERGLAVLTDAQRRLVQP